MASHAKSQVPSTSEFYTFVLSALHHSWEACDFRSPSFFPAFSMLWRYLMIVCRRTSVSSFNLERSSPVTCCSWHGCQRSDMRSRPRSRPFRRPPQFESRCRASSLARLLLQQSNALMRKCIHDSMIEKNYLYARKPVGSRPQKSWRNLKKHLLDMDSRTPMHRKLDFWWGLLHKENCSFGIPEQVTKVLYWVTKGMIKVSRPERGLNKSLVLRYLAKQEPGRAIKEIKERPPRTCRKHDWKARSCDSIARNVSCWVYWSLWNIPRWTTIYLICKLETVWHLCWSSIRDSPQAF